MIVLEVRCCCVPGRVLGTLQVQHGLGHAGGTLTLVKRRRLSWQEFPKPGDTYPIEFFQLEVLLFQRDDGMQYPAVQAHEDQLPDLRLVPGFTESK